MNIMLSYMQTMSQKKGSFGEGELARDRRDKKGWRCLRWD